MIGPSATVRKITLMLGTNKYLVPDTYDNLPEGMEFCRELILDPFCPVPCRELLRSWFSDAAHILEACGQ